MALIYLSAKCDDRCNVAVLNEAGEEIFHETGYVPVFIPNHYSDYVRLQIDSETGQIINWQPFTEHDFQDGKYLHD